MNKNLSERLLAKSVKNTVVNNIAQDFNLTSILAEAYFNQIKNYFTNHADPNLSSCKSFLLYFISRPFSSYKQS